MVEGYPDRMADAADISPTRTLFENDRLGQKNGKGFYLYQKDRRGKPGKFADDSVAELFKPLISHYHQLTDEDIVARYMVPMCIELAHCLESGVVGSPAEADMAMVYGLGFPAFRGGVFRWMDEMGLDNFCAMADRLGHLGKLYAPTEKMREMAASGEGYYG
jgi:3-hydroxyacyl-CoA dehydrogenase/enoyl-CoA hydratase/3-hydroxybutyryl-CoA epimerase/enoyl-CoA isomerase